MIQLWFLKPGQITRDSILTLGCVIIFSGYQFLDVEIGTMLKSSIEILEYKIDIGGGAI